METTRRQSGNAMVYVLIVVALMAALIFVIARQNGSSDNNTLSSDQVEIEATQILQTGMQVKQAVETMLFSGSRIDTLDFTPPSDPAFDTPPTIQKIFHPDGGGLTLPALSKNAAVAGSDPAPGWYLGRFNNVEWSQTTASDVILGAHNINKQVCAKIDEKLTGNPTIPVAAVPSRTILFSSANHTGGNADLTAAACPDCEGRPALCIEDSGGNKWDFYSIIETR